MPVLAYKINVSMARVVSASSPRQYFRPSADYARPLVSMPAYAFWFLMINSGWWWKAGGFNWHGHTRYFRFARWLHTPCLRFSFSCLLALPACLARKSSMCHVRREWAMTTIMTANCEKWLATPRTSARPSILLADASDEVAAPERGHAHGSWRRFISKMSVMHEMSISAVVGRWRR